MSIVRKARAEWAGDLMSGKGQIEVGSKAFGGRYSFKGRTTESSPETNPEELLGGSLAGCFTMQLSALLTKAGKVPESIYTTAHVYLNKDESGFVVSKISLETEGKVQDISPEEFSKHAATAKAICPISRALAAVTIELTSTLTK